VKVLVPQPSVAGAHADMLEGGQMLESVQNGSVTVTLSPTARGELHLKDVATVVALPVIGVAITIAKEENVESAPEMTGEMVATFATFEDLASVTSTVRSTTLAADPVLGRVMLFAISILHAVF